MLRCRKKSVQGTLNNTMKERLHVCELSAHVNPIDLQRDCKIILSSVLSQGAQKNELKNEISTGGAILPTAANKSVPTPKVLTPENALLPWQQMPYRRSVQFKRW